MPSPSDASRDGFVLVGVVMFVLALTILGLAVFSLSSYEAQFMHQSLDDLQAYNGALSGLQRACYVLSVEDSLRWVRTGLAPGDTAVALQKDGAGVWQPDGPINPSDTVIVMAGSRVGEADHMLTARYTFQSNDSPYKRTITSAQNVYVDPSDQALGAYARTQTIKLGYGARQVLTDWSWLGLLNPGGVPQDTTRRPVPIPSVSSFITAHESVAAPAPATYTPGAVPQYTLTNPDPNHVKYFLWPDSGNVWTRKDVTTVGPRILVSGRVVLMFPRGFHVEYPASVVSNGNPATDGLVIVAGSSQSPEPNLGMMVGIEFASGFVSTQVPVVLVSDGAVDLDQVNGYNSSAEYLSVYAHGAYLRGPIAASGLITTYSHDRNAPEDAVGGFIDWLALQGALPNATGGGTSKLVLVAGSWQDVTP